MARIVVRLAALVLMCAALVPSGAVQAGTQLVEASPRPGAALATPPPRLQLLFDEELDADKSQLRVYGPGGQRSDRRDQQVDGVRMWVSLRDQGPGVYQVRWRAVADDDKGTTQGSYTFTITPTAPTGAPQIWVNPATANNGQPVSVAGSGFTPNGSVVLSVGDAEDLLAVAIADGRGAFAVQATLPAGLPFGRQVMQATDAADNLATAALWVPTGGGPVAAVVLAAETEEQTVTYTLRVENRSGYQLGNLVLRALIPLDTRVLAEGTAQPDGASAPDVGGGQVVWRLRSLPAHAVSGPFSFAVSARGLPEGAQLSTLASVEFVHTASAPEFRGAARSTEVVVQVAP